MRRRVVITGLGPVGATGVGVDAFWQALLDGRSGLARIEAFDPSGFPVRHAGAVEGVAVKDHVPKSYRKATKVMARDSELAVVAAKLAAEDAGIATRGSDDDAPGHRFEPERLGCQIGAGLLAAESGELGRAVASSTDDQGVWTTTRWGSGEGGDAGMNNLPPLWMLKYLPNMLACHVTIIHGAEGPSNTILAGEASGLLSVGEGARVIERGDADACFAGGAESKLNPMGLVRMDLLGLLAHADDDADAPALVRPFDPEAPGAVLGEGGGIALIESHDSASARGARMYAEVAGFGASMTPLNASPEDGSLHLAIDAALRDAGVSASDIGAVVPYGAGVPASDAMERAALERVFGDRLEQIPLITIAPQVGTTFAGQGGLALAAGALAVHHKTVPARTHAGSAPGLDAGPSGSCDAPLDAVVVCTTSLGGQNAAVVLTRA